jgi:23S rRNA pseudouridine955/2504/2580 synthase
MVIELWAGDDDGGRRLDRLLRKALPDLPLSGLHRLLRKGRVLVDGKPAQAEDRVQAGARIVLPGFAGGPHPEPPLPAAPLPLPPALPSPLPADAPPLPPALDIIGEGAGLLILNKPPGVLVHGPDSLESRVRNYLRGRLPPSLSFRPGPLHRLDRPTSGIIAFSTSLEGARNFSLLLRQARIRKNYLALAEGEAGEAAIWEDGLFRDRERKKTFSGGDDLPGIQKARTRVFTLARAPGYSLLRLEIGTGRTHQIRAQAALHGCPLAGDRKYGGSPQRGGLFLHAYSLEFPPGAVSPLPDALEAPLPGGFRRRIRELFGIDLGA